MKLMRLVCACAAAAALMSATASAMNSTALAKANVPFEFVVNGKAMPAGEYTFSPSGTAGVIAIQGGKKGGRILAVGGRVYTSPVQDAPRLVFVKKNGRMHLSQVLPQISGSGASFQVK